MADEKRSREKFLYRPEAHNDHFFITFDGSGQAVRTPPEGPASAPAPTPEPEAEEPAGIYPCPCCGYLTFHIPIEAAIAGICPVCYWENDVFDPGEDDPSDENGGMTLRQGRENFRKYGAVRPDLVRYVRPPLPGEIPPDL